MIISGVGRLGRSAELRYTPSGMAVCNLAVAFNHGQKQQDGSRLSQWLDLALWGKQAESLAQYLLKGNQVSITASDPHIETFTKNDGTQANKLVATIINIELIGSKDKDAASQAAPQQAPQQQRPAQQFATQDNFGAMDEDIPFMRIQHEMVW